MILTTEEKKFIHRLLKKERRNPFLSKRKRRMINRLMFKFHQNSRNVTINEIKESSML